MIESCPGNGLYVPTGQGNWLEDCVPAGQKKRVLHKLGKTVPAGQKNPAGQVLQSSILVFPNSSLYVPAGQLS